MRESSAVHRSEWLDVLRGAAMVWMTIFHFCFDLNHFGFLKADFYRDSFWTWQRLGIVSLFVFAMGAGQALSWQRGQGLSRFWARWRQIAAGALIVTLGSVWMFPQSFIYFGILHSVAVMLILLRLLASKYHSLWVLFLLGAVALLIPLLARWAHVNWPALQFLNQPGFNVLGVISQKPVTQDFVPVFPWLGVALWGLVACRWVSQARPGWLSLSAPHPLQGLGLLGRWSLSYYLLHQPVLMGALYLAVRLGL